MGLWLLTMLTLLTATRPQIGSALIQSKTFLQRPDLADEVFVEGLLFQSPARSNLECLWRCSSTPSCVSYTHTPSSGTRDGFTCRGHAPLLSVQSLYVAAPGSKTFVSTAGKLQSAGGCNDTTGTQQGAGGLTVPQAHNKVHVDVMTEGCR